MTFACTPYSFRPRYHALYDMVSYLSAFNNRSLSKIVSVNQTWTCQNHPLSTIMLAAQIGLIMLPLHPMRSIPGFPYLSVSINSLVGEEERSEVLYIKHDNLGAKQDPSKTTYTLSTILVKQCPNATTSDPQQVLRATCTQASVRVNERSERGRSLDHQQRRASL